MVFSVAVLLKRSAPGNNPEQNHDNGDDEQDMDQSTHGGSRHQAQEPKNQQNHRKGV